MPGAALGAGDAPAADGGFVPPAGILPSPPGLATRAAPPVLDGGRATPPPCLALVRAPSGRSRRARVPSTWGRRRQTVSALSTLVSTASPELRRRGLWGF